MKKKVLIINTKYTIFGGEDANIQQEINLLSSEYEVDYLEFKNTKDINFYDLLAFFTGNNYRSNKILKSYLKDFKPDIVYVHNTWYKANLGIFKILFKENITTVLKIHNFRYDCTRYFLSKNHLKKIDVCYKCGYKKNINGLFNKYFQDSYLKSLFVILYGKKYFKILNNNSLKIIVLNKFHKEYLEGVGIQQNVHIISNPLSTHGISKNQYNPQSLNIVYAGQISKQKGVDILIKVWNKFQNKNLVLNLIGKVVDEDLVENQKNKSIIYHGEKSNIETLNFISSSRAVITTTKMFEGHPRLLSEASIMGVPSIYPSFGGMDEYFPKEYGLNFIQFDYEDLLLKLNKLHNIDFLTEVSKDIMENYILEFSIKNNLERLREVFNI